MLTFACPGCRKVYTKDAGFAGMQARCKQCGIVFQIPTPRPEPELDDRYGLADEVDAAPVPVRRPAPSPMFEDGPKWTKKAAWSNDSHLGLARGAFGAAIAALVLGGPYTVHTNANGASNLSTFLGMAALKFFLALLAFSLGLTAWNRIGRSKGERGGGWAKAAVILGGLLMTSWGGVLAIWLYRSARPPAAAGPRGGPAAVPQTYESKPENFSIQFPGAPRKREQIQDTPAGKVRMTILEATDWEGSGFVLMVCDLPDPATVVDDQQAQLMLDAGVDAAIQAGHWNPQERRQIVLGSGHPGRALVMRGQLPGGRPGQEITMHARIYLIGNRLYQMFAGGRDGSTASLSPENFFNTFALLQPVAPPQGAAQSVTTPVTRP